MRNKMTENEKDYGPHEVRSKRDSLAQDSGASAADVFPLSSEAFHLLRSLPKWNGPNVSGAFATQATDELCRMGLAVGSLAAADRPFDEDEDDPRVWRTMAGDVLLATVGAMQTPEAIALSRPDAVSGHKNTPIPAKQGEGLAAAVEQAWFEVSPMVRGQERIKAFGIFERLKAAALANLTEQDEAPPLDEWQPISDAPKDGNPILSWDGRYISITFWRRTGLRHQWVSELTGAGQEPTHWKPLPQPPIGNLPNAGGEA